MVNLEVGHSWENFTCYHYDKEGHIKRNCKTFKREQKIKKKVDEQDTTITISNVYEEV